jgi:hypothetical protein
MSKKKRPKLADRLKKSLLEAIQAVKQDKPLKTKRDDNGRPSS